MLQNQSSNSIKLEEKTTEQLNTEMWFKLSQQLKPIKVQIEGVFLDPNNPRFGLDEPIPENRTTENAVQERCLDEIRNKKGIGIDDLIESIKNCGFSTIDRIVLKAVAENSFIVLEGNRRVAAMKVLKIMHNTAEETLKDDVLKSISKFDALVYEGNEQNIAWLIQGLRHASGIREWDDYPKAKFITMMYESGYESKEIANRFGMKPRAEVMKLIRSYYAFEQAKQDEDWGSELKPDKFNMFYEIVFKKPTIKEWLGWEDNEMKFKNLDNFALFVSLIVPGEKGKSKLDISSTSRDTFPELIKMENHYLLEKLVEDKISIDEAQTEIIRKSQPCIQKIDIPNALEKLKKFLDYIEILPIAPIQMAQKTTKSEFTDVLTKLSKTIEKQIENIGKNK
ncbi:MAG: hypothetical protein QME42_07105 [bacterium]|nr:hypothetical protein [bacterium]